jgi:ubiquinone biosynthesis protein COQ9
MWRLAGDVAADFNHYTKRAILGGVYATTLAVWVGDESAGKAESRAFLARRIGDVMQFEKAKAKLLSGDERRFSMARFVGRLRYPVA